MTGHPLIWIGFSLLVLAGMVDKFHYLKTGLGVVLAFVGVKMPLAHTPYKIDTLFLLLVACGVIYLILGEKEARAMWYTTLIIANLGLILSNRSRIQGFWSTLRIPNGAMGWVLGGATVFLSLVLAVPALRDIFRFAPLHPLDIAFCLAAGIGNIAGFELIKYWHRRQTQPIL